MRKPKSSKPNVTIGPSGTVLTAADLPPQNTRRWMPSRKAVVIHAVRGNVVTREFVMKHYNISPKELQEWEHWYDQYGMSGLRVTHIQDHRPPHSNPLKDFT